MPSKSQLETEILRALPPGNCVFRITAKKRQTFFTLRSLASHKHQIALTALWPWLALVLIRIPKNHDINRCSQCVTQLQLPFARLMTFHKCRSELASPIGSPLLVQKHGTAQLAYGAHTKGRGLREDLRGRLREGLQGGFQGKLQGMASKKGLRGA